MSTPTHPPARMVGGKRVPNANPNRPHRDEDDDLTPQTSVGTAFGGSGVSDIAVVHVKTDSEEKAKHDKLHAPHTAHQDQKFNNSNRPDMKGNHGIQQPRKNNY